MVDADNYLSVAAALAHCSVSQRMRGKPFGFAFLLSFQPNREP